MTEIGATLREARMRRHIDITEVESATKIRAKYLRAMEDEEWDLLPGPTFVKSFLRTYADYLGLDSRLLSSSGSATTSGSPRPSCRRWPPRGSSSGALGARASPGRWRGVVLALCVIAILVGGLYVLGQDRRRQQRAAGAGHLDHEEEDRGRSPRRRPRPSPRRRRSS